MVFQPFGLAEQIMEVLYQIRVQIQSGNLNIVSETFRSNNPITAQELERTMAIMIDQLKAAGRQDLIPQAHGIAAQISKTVRTSLVGNGGVTQGGNFLREWFRDVTHNGKPIRFDVENLRGTNLVRCR